MSDRRILSVVVDAMHLETDGVVSLRLRSADGQQLPASRAGDHIDVHLANGLVRQYSLCNGMACCPDRYLIAVKLDPSSRGGSSFVHRQIRVGDKLEIGLPRSNFELVHDAPAVLIAAGIGITPIASMAHELAHDDRPFDLHYFSRSPAEVVFAERWADPWYRARIHTGLARHETTAHLTRILSESPESAQIYVCGPAGFIETTLDIARADGRSDSSLHSERFTPTTSTKAIDTSTSIFCVRANRSGIEIEVAEGESIADALMRCGIDVPLSCEQGICGTCVTPVLDGIPDHRDDYLTDDEKAANDEMCLCVSRSKSAELVLDI